MFKDSIATTALTDNSADEFFPRITGDNLGGDTTFVATLRALLDSRLPESESVTFKVLRIYDTEFNDYLSRVWKDNTVCLVNVIHDSRSYTAEEKIKNSMESYTQYVQLSKVTEFYRKFFEVYCYVNESTKTVLLFVPSLDNQKYHFLQCSILAFLPWYFNSEKGVSPLEMELMNSLQSKTPENYLACLEKIAEQMNLSERKVRKYLKEFESSYELKRIEVLQNNLWTYEDEIERNRNALAQILSQKRNDEIELLGLKTKVANTAESSELMEFFLTHKDIKLVNVCNSTMYFSAKGYLEYFDEDMAMSVIENDKSFIYAGHSAIRDKMRLFMTALVKGKIKIKFGANFKFEIGKSVSAPREFSDTNPFFSECMPNPHLVNYGCLGNYQMVLNELLVKNDYIMLIEQCIASTKSLNFGDAPVMEAFMSYIYTDNRRFVELPDGSLACVKDTIEYLEEENE